ncbi:hypothetical protein [Candidatus Odyssella thessalonicensis]|uniref:hypothetical protein n=1 Tax=Candidatus Odyssella thessalonicensis TaxID=84647 RepID=UPI000225C14A|nr:hypothetical protein [Candidatus Odyssella thessalonicensis]
MLKYFKFLPYISHLSFSLMAMEQSSISAPFPGHAQEFRRADPFASERQQMTDDDFVRHLITLNLNNNGEAQYELFRIFSQGECGRSANPKTAINFGLKARNRPDPIPEILIELPLFAFKMHEILKSRNDGSAADYLFIALNLSPITFFHGLFKPEEIINNFATSGPAMRPIDFRGSILAHKNKKNRLSLIQTVIF